ncbi:hypothetical protein QVD17_17593 [Tagetes erecta]|uniref:SOSEKI DIX-like domain-containing protein n=1 Tax=Tagetes erecta TaxID=13708 RepID=A0AAD8KWC3_TARER|nr:hypothetical protein QVD17_17593 [Tagetes erecta]
MDLISKPSNRRKWNNDQLSPDRTKVWIEPNKQRRVKVPVVYYLCRNGQLEHPHFVEVPLSTSDGLYLRDVIDRLNSLRGKGMAALYSWSSKRSYKTGFVWHDLSENDFIYPAHGHEYILKGSELFDGHDASFQSKSDESPLSSSKKSSSETLKSTDEFELSIGRSRRNQSWSAIDLQDYKVYSNESSAVRLAADASTQTDSSRNHQRAIINEVEEEDKQSESYLSRDEISPPPSDSSTETLESLMKSDKLILRSETNVDNPTVGGKTKASTVLMQLISCGSISFRDCGPGKPNLNSDQDGYKTSYFVSKGNMPKMLTRGDVDDHVEEDAGEEKGENGVVLMGKCKGKKVMVIEDKEYFSGSLIETKKDKFPALKRSNSYNANG